MDKIKGKVKPAETHVKVQYEGEELTIKELVDKLEYCQESQEYLKWVVVEREKEIALLKSQLSDAQPVRHGRWKLVGEDSRLRGGTWICTACNTCQPYVSDYCPHCGAKMDGGKP